MTGVRGVASSSTSLTSCRRMPRERAWPEAEEVLRRLFWKMVRARIAASTPAEPAEFLHIWGRTGSSGANGVQRGNIRWRQFDLWRLEEFDELLDAGGADNRCRDVGLGDQPGERDLRRYRIVPRRHLVDGIEDAQAARVEVAL